jgi:hypothetical protein
VAATLPTTIPERRVLGPAKQRLYEAAETAGQKMAEAAAERVMGTRPVTLATLGTGRDFDLSARATKIVREEYLETYHQWKLRNLGPRP